MSILTIIFLLLVCIFGLVFLIDIIRFRKEINAFVKCGIVCAVIMVGIDMVLLASISGAFSTIPMPLLVVLLILEFVRIVIATCMGIYCCSLIKIRAFQGDRLLLADTEQKEQRLQLCLVYVGMTVILSVVYSVLLFLTFKPEISEALKQAFGVQESGMSMGLSLPLVILCIWAAVSEELIFRLAIQNYLAKQFKLNGDKYWIAIVLTAAFWSLAHVGTLEPEWVKLAQVFPLGIGLGVIFRKFGTEACIITHGTFNIIMAFLSSYLIQI